MGLYKNLVKIVHGSGLIDNLWDFIASTSSKKEKLIRLFLCRDCKDFCVWIINSNDSFHSLFWEIKPVERKLHGGA
jgi:hypothetical protein